MCWVTSAGQMGFNTNDIRWTTLIMQPAMAFPIPRAEREKDEYMLTLIKSLKFTLMIWR